MGFGMAAASAVHMQTICTSLQTGNHTNTLKSFNFHRPDALLTPNQQCQSTEGTNHYHSKVTLLQLTTIYGTYPRPTLSGRPPSANAMVNVLE